MKEPHRTADNIADIDSASGSTKANGSASLNFSEGELGQIQKILFGKQLLENNNRLSSLSAETEEKLRHICSNFDAQLDSLNKRLDSSLKDLKQQIEQAEHAFATTQTQLSKEFSKNKQQLVTQLSTTSNKADKQQQKLQADLVSYQNELKHSLELTRAELLERMDHAVNELKSGKLDQGALSRLLGNMAKELSADTDYKEESIVEPSAHDS